MKDSNIFGIFVFFLIFLMPINLSAENKVYEFKMKCKILDSVILSIKEGQSTRYDYYNDEYQKGDYMTLVFKHTVYNPSYGNSYNLHVYDSTGNINVMVDATDFDNYFEEYLTYKGSYANDVYLSKNYINLDGSYGGEFDASRYYKDDWQATFTRNRKNSSQNMTLNCPGVSNNFNMLINRLEDFHPSSD